PGAALFECFAIGRNALVLRILDLEAFGEVRGEPLAKLAAERGMLGAVGEVHRRLLPDARISVAAFPLNCCKIANEAAKRLQHEPHPHRGAGRALPASRLPVSVASLVAGRT